MAALVFPFHDPKNIETKFLRRVLPVLKDNFDRAYVSVTPKTEALNPETVKFLSGDNFFVVNFNSTESAIGEHLLNGYKNALEHSKPDDVLHLCYSDRLAFAILNYREAFLNDVGRLNKEDCPLLFCRSAKAWLTHPANYWAAESMVTKAGEMLFGRTLGFGWCHLVVTTKQLNEVWPKLTARNLEVVAQLVLNLNGIKMKDVDWLSWEDPFILDKDSLGLKAEREKDPLEVEKRMNYVLPQIKYLFEEYIKTKNTG
jgi:hypothetical protein